MATEQVNTTAKNESRALFPKSPMPAWVPAVTVATGMMIFLAASFYIRHRKVMKKRQILMDYFYIIFQYGGVRRKRMVAALCNTNSITLRQLGKSFMISFDSIANTENSCPFFLEETAFSSHQPTSIPIKKTLFRSKSRTGGLSNHRLRPPLSPHREEASRGQNPAGFQEILMKFKKKSPAASPSEACSPMRNLMPPKLGSLCSIHDDDPAAHISFLHSQDEPHNAQERRKSYILSYDSSGSAVIEETFDKPVIPNVVLERLKQQSTSGKRNSEPIYYEGGYDPYGNPRLRILPDDGTKFYGTRVLYPSSSDRSDNKVEYGSPYRNSEPTILIHSASNDFDSDCDMEDTQSQCSNGLVFVKKVTNADGTVERYYVNERPMQNFNPNHRPSLSKVSYVPGGNMNEYYQNCLSSPKKSKSNLQQSVEESEKNEIRSEEKGHSSKKHGAKKASENAIPIPTISRRGRLSLGDIAVSNFNRRIVDFPSESLGSKDEGDVEAGRVSKDQARNKPAIAWRRLKNVFSGSRSSQSSVTKMKNFKSFQASEDRSKRVGRRGQGKWARFVNVFMGFKSLSESKCPKAPLSGPKNSNSLPSGLNRQILNSDRFDFTQKYHGVSLESAHCVNLGPDQHSVFPNGSRVMTRTITPVGIRAPPKTQSFPEDILKLNDPIDTSVTPHLCPQSPRRVVVKNPRPNDHKFKKHNMSYDGYFRSRSHSEVHRHFHKRGSQSSNEDPYYKRQQTLSAMSSPRSKSPFFSLTQDFDKAELKNRDRRYRSLSPLPDKWFKSSSRRGSTSSRLYSLSARNSFSEKEKSVLPYLANSVDLAFTLGLINSRLLNDFVPEINEKIAASSLPTEKRTTRGRQSSVSNLNHTGNEMASLSIANDEKYNESIANHRGNISAHSTDKKNVKDVKCKSQAFSVDNSDKAASRQIQSMTLDVTLHPPGSSMDSVYFDTVSHLSSPSNSVKQNTAPNTPLCRAGHCILDMSCSEKECLLPKTEIKPESTPFYLSSNDRNVFDSNSEGGLVTDVENSHSCHASKKNVDFRHKSYDKDIIGQPISNYEQEYKAVCECEDLKPSLVSRGSVTSQSSLRSRASINSKPSTGSRVSFDSQLSIISSPSVERQYSNTSLTSKLSESKEIRTIDDLLQESLDKTLNASCGDKLSSLDIDDGHGPEEPLLDVESNMDRSESQKAKGKDFPLQFPSQGCATFQIISETPRKSSPEEIAILNLTRLPRFGRRASQCTQSPLSESLPGSGNNTPLQPTSVLPTNGVETPLGMSVTGTRV